MQPNKKSSPSFAVIFFALGAIVALIYYFGFPGGSSNTASAAETTSAAAASSSPSAATVDLKPSQLNAIKIESVGTHSFHVEKEAVGSIAYHEKDAHSGILSKFVVANVPESASTLIHVGQPVETKVVAYPDRVFSGKVSLVGVTVYDSGGNPAIDPNTHRIAVRCEIADPKNELYPGMLATIVIQVQKPVESVGIPANGVVRKGDGTMTVWVTEDRRRFEERTVKIGLQQNGYDQILEGLKPGELVATDGAVFISNVLYAPPSD